MSRFFSSSFANLTPYTPGEQPKERKFIKLNTNESPFAPSKAVQEAALAAAKNLQLYPDPECTELTAILCRQYGIEKDEILWTNGSDDVLNFAFMAFCDHSVAAAFPDITYGFYPVFANANGVSFETIPLADDFSIRISDYFGIGKTIFIANPNAPTGLALTPRQIEEILIHNPDRVVVIDEAYVDFGAESCVPLIHQYDNLLVTQTFSKSRSMAGARLGFGIGCKELIQDLNTIKYSTNPYNINAMTMAAGIATLSEPQITKNNCQIICENREYTAEKLKALGFEMTCSSANFLFVKHPRISGADFYRKWKEKGVLVRHFPNERICDYSRVTVGSREEMDLFLEYTKRILEECQ